MSYSYRYSLSYSWKKCLLDSECGEWIDKVKVLWNSLCLSPEKTQWLRHWNPISDPCDPGSVPLGGFKFSSIVNPSEVDQMSTKNPWGSSGKKETLLLVTMQSSDSWTLFTKRGNKVFCLFACWLVSLSVDFKFFSGTACKIFLDQFTMSCNLKSDGARYF